MEGTAPATGSSVCGCTFGIVAWVTTLRWVMTVAVDPDADPHPAIPRARMAVAARLRIGLR